MAPFTSPLAEELAPDLLDRFQRYVRVDTQSRRDGNGQTPSTPGQLDLSRMRVEELRAAGLDDAELDDNGYVMATLAATVDGDAPVVGLIAHVCGLSAIARIERCIAYVATGTGLSAQALGAALADRMTESVIAAIAALAQLGHHGGAPRPLGVVRLGDDGAATLRQASQRLGLALAEDEIA